METQFSNTGNLMQQMAGLLEEGGESDHLSQALLNSMSGLLELYQSQQTLGKIYSQLNQIILHLVELDKSKNIDTVLSELATAARSLLESDAIVIIPTTPDGDTFIPHHTTIVGQGKKYFKATRKPRPKGITAYLISSPSGFINIQDCSDLNSYPFLDPDPNSFLNNAGVRCFLALRLGNKTRIHGFFFVNRVSLKAFTQEQMQLAELLGALISIALQIHTSVDTLIQPIHTEALQKIQQAINIVTESEKETDLQDFLFRLLDTALQITDVKEDGFGFVGLVDKIESKLKIYAQVGKTDIDTPSTIDIGTDNEKPEGISGWVVRNGRPLLVPDVRKDERYLEIFRRNTISELAVPLRVKANVIGVINLESSKPESFTENDLHLLEGLANLASIAVHVIRTRQAQHDDSTFANVIITSLDTTETLNRFYDYVHARTKARDMAILSYDVDRNVLHLDEFPLRASAHAEKLPEVPFGKGVSGNAAKQDKVIYIGDVQKLVKGSREYIAWLSDTRSNMAIPLRIGHRLIGVLNLESPTPFAFDEVDGDQLQIMASFAAIALENAKRYQNTVNFQTSSAFVGLFVSKFHDLFGNTIKPAAVRLESLELKLLENKTRGPASNIRKSLSKEIESIRETIDQGINDAHRLAMSAKETGRISSYLEYKDNKSFDEGLGLALSRLEIPPMIQLMRNYQDDVAWVTVSGPIHVILRNLLKNSVEAINRVGGAGAITLTAEQRLGWLYIVVEDTGCGIPEKDVEKIFEIGYTARDRGLGLGLHVTRELVELFGGKIIIKSSKRGKTAFAFSLPIIDDGGKY